MNPHLTVLTLGVEDLERAVAFYRDGLGWRTQGIIGTEFDHGAVAFFDLRGGLKLALWPRSSIAADSGLTPRQSGWSLFPRPGKVPLCWKLPRNSASTMNWRSQ